MPNSSGVGTTYTVAVFDLRRPSEFVNGAGFFVQDGEQQHRGVEINAIGRVLSNLELVAGAAWLDPVNEKTGDSLTDGKRPVSVPRITANLFADYGITAVPGLYVNAGLYHNGKQFIDGANLQELDSWTRFDLGARYETRVGDMGARFQLGIENVADENYWVGQAGVLTLADPRTYKLTARTSPVRSS